MKSRDKAVAATKAKHSSARDDWGTGERVSRLARLVMGGIDLDPASSPSANRFVGARTIYTEEDDGLYRPWQGRVFLNPPGGAMNHRLTRSKAALWWARLAMSYLRGDVDEAIFVCFSIETFQVAQATSIPWLPTPADFPFCVPRKRMEFIEFTEDGPRPGKSPSHANAIVYLPPRDDLEESSKLFAAVFSELGKVRL